MTFRLFCFFSTDIPKLGQYSPAEAYLSFDSFPKSLYPECHLSLPTDPMNRINLISSPRNISTAMMYSFAQRSDTQVVDEPFYGYYLSIRKVDHPGREEIIRTMETNPAKIVDNLLRNGGKPIFFIKNMAHHLINIEERFFREVTNLFLIRNPVQLIASFSQVIKTPTMDDIGVKKQHEMYCWLKQSGEKPIVLDSGELLKNPGRILALLCATLGIAFEPSMLSWNPGPRPEDGIWAKHWYQSVHQSTSFARQSTSARPLQKELEPLRLEALPFYSKLYAASIMA